MRECMDGDWELNVPHIQNGKVVVEESITFGFNNIVDAFLSMLKGGNIGKALVSIEPGM